MSMKKPLPKYKNNSTGKIVKALKVYAIAVPNNAKDKSIFIFDDHSYPNIEVTIEWMRRNNPSSIDDGYYIEDRHGETDYMSAKDFEATHTLIK